MSGNCFRSIRKQLYVSQVIHKAVLRSIVNIKTARPGRAVFIFNS